MMIFPRFSLPLFSLRIFAVCILAAMLSAGGCAQNTDSTATKTNATAGSAAGSTSPETTPSATWNEALQKWWQALSQPKAPQKNAPPVAASTANAPTQDKIAAIAARHPAWKLADALEKNPALPLQFEAIASRFPKAGSTPKAPNFDVDFPVATTTTDSFAATPNAGENQNRNLPAPALSETASGEIERGEDDFAAPIVITPNSEALREAARARQENSIADFLRDAQMRQADWQRDYRAVLQTALGEEIKVAQQRAPATLALVLPSPELQLEMTNLRLQLLSNVFSTPEERNKSRARLQELMALWRAALAKQEKIRADELERLRVEEPARLRRAGMANLEAQLEIIRRAQQANRDAIAAEHRARLEADFGNENARLSVALPPLHATGVLPAADETPYNNGGNQPNPLLEKFNFSRTRVPRSTSVKGFSGIAATRTDLRDARATQIRDLRALAWHDAKRQAKMAQRLEN